MVDRAQEFWPDIRDMWSAMLSAAPAPEGGAAPFDRDGLIALIMEETTDDIVAGGWNRLGKPNVLVQGCRYIRRNAPPIREGYENPEASAKQFAGFIADRILKALATREEAPAEAGEAINWKAEYETLCGQIIKDREAIAKIIDPEAFVPMEDVIGMRKAFVKADAILALRAQPQARKDAQPVGFSDEIAWLREAARYFSARNTNGEDRAHWANVYNAENANKLADRLAELSSNPCQLRRVTDADPVAWRSRLLDAFGDGSWSVTTYKPSADEVQPLYTHPTPNALRLAVEALEAQEDQSKRGFLFMTREELDRVTTLRRQALAALQAEQKGGA